MCKILKKSSRKGQRRRCVARMGEDKIAEKDRSEKDMLGRDGRQQGMGQGGGVEGHEAMRKER